MYPHNDNRDNEIWKDIPGYEGMYQVSNQGRVKSLKRKGRRNNKILRPIKHRDGYLKVHLWLNGTAKTIKVHKLVMLAFTGKRSSELEINHIDGNKVNNHISNLEYCTHLENIHHAMKMGLRKTKLTESQVLEIRKQYKSGNVTHSQLAKRYNVNERTIGRIITREYWKHI